MANERRSLSIRKSPLLDCTCDQQNRFRAIIKSQLAKKVAQNALGSDFVFSARVGRFVHSSHKANNAEEVVSCSELASIQCLLCRPKTIQLLTIFAKGFSKKEVRV